MGGNRIDPSIYDVRMPPRPKPDGNSYVPRSLAVPHDWRDGGVRRDRTDDLMLAKHALYQLSYDPSFQRRPAKAGSTPEGVVVDLSVRPRVTLSVVGPGGLEPPTSRLSGVCSNQLSYRP